MHAVGNSLTGPDSKETHGRGSESRNPLRKQVDSGLVYLKIFRKHQHAQHDQGVFLAGFFGHIPTITLRLLNQRPVRPECCTTGSKFKTLPKLVRSFREFLSFRWELGVKKGKMYHP